MKSKSKIYDYNPGIHGKDSTSYYEQLNKISGNISVSDAEAYKERLRISAQFNASVVLAKEKYEKIKKRVAVE